MIFKSFLRKLFLYQISCFILAMHFFASNISAQTKISDRGDVTGLPLPRFVSIKSNKVNARRGPNATYQIDWVYTRAGVPLKVTAEYENWRKVEDFEGEGGWVHSRLLSGKRFVIVLDSEILLKRKPNKNSPILAVIKKGVIARLISNVGVWSEIAVEGYSGWVRDESIWGASNKTTLND